MDYRLIEEGADYALSIAQDESGFLLRSKQEGTIAVLNGEDCSRFRQDYKEIKERYPQWGSDQLLAQLWDQGGYGWLAQQDE
jgi:hypothetical protein